MSPVVIMQNKYNYKCDIWSLGITAIEIAEGEPPFSKTKAYLVLKKIISQPPKGLKFKDKWSKDFNDFIEKWLIYDPNESPSAKELLKHSFIVKNNKGNKLISELIIQLINNCFDDLVFYRKKILEDSNYEEEENNNSIIYKDNSKDFNPQNYNDNNGIMINKEGCNTIINLENKKNYDFEEEKNEFNQSVNIKESYDDKNENPLLKMINEYGGMDGLSFEIKDNPENTIKAEETKMNENHIQYTKNNNIYNNCININNDKCEIDDIINDPTVNHLLMMKLKMKFLKLKMK